jgi:hypothetical protein
MEILVDQLKVAISINAYQDIINLFKKNVEGFNHDVA